jgi:hypothetical protein
MPELSPKTKQYHKQRVRSLMVQQPTITIEGMRRHLAAQDLPLDRHYIASLVKQIQTERIRRADTWTLNIALASFQDAMGEIVRVGWEIALPRGQAAFRQPQSPKRHGADLLG